METPKPEQDSEDVTTEYLLKMVEDIPLENSKFISQAMQRCRSLLDGWPGSGRLLGPETLCPSCSTPWLCGRYRAELRPRPVATKPLRRLMNKHREGRPMGRLQTRLVERFMAARDLIVLECKICNRVTKLPVVSRSGRGRSVPDPAATPAPVAPAATARVTPGTTPSASGRRRSRARDKSAGLVIPASLRTHRTPATPVAAAAASVAIAEAAETLPDLGQSPSVRQCPESKQPPACDRLCAESESSDPAAVSVAPIPLKKSRAPLPPVSAGLAIIGTTPGGATSSAIPLKKRREGPESGKRGGVGATPATRPAPSSASAREKHRRLQKILAQEECRTSNTGLMAFLSEL